MLLLCQTEMDYNLFGIAMRVLNFFSNSLIGDRLFERFRNIAERVK